MPNLIDLTKVQFGNLTVLRRVYKRKRKRKQTFWLCQCLCGRKTVVWALSLRQGKTRSCGCARPRWIGNKTRTHGLSKTRQYKLWQAAKRRAQKQGLEFTIAPQDVIIPFVCPVLGIPIVRNSIRLNDSPSIDRLDNTRGYTRENIWVISWRANHLKSDATLQELEQLIEAWRHKLTM